MIQEPSLRPKADTRGGDRRAHLRYETNEPALAVIGNVAAACRLSDISMGGALIEGNLPLSQGELFNLCILDLPEIPSKAVHCGNGYYGVQFQDTARFRKAIGIWIRRRMHGK